MAGLIFIQAGESHQRDVFRREGRVVWSDGLPLVLEKHGYLFTQQHDTTVFGCPEKLVQPDVLLVGRLPESAWSDTAHELISNPPSPLLLDGPLSPVVAAQLGITVKGSLTHDGAIVVRDPDLRERAVESFGVTPGGPLLEPRSAPLSLDSAMQWSSLKDVPITSLQAKGWRKRGWDVDIWKVGQDWTVLADWCAAEDARERYPAIIQRGSMIACCFDLFGYLVQCHTAEPVDGAEWRLSTRSLGVEALLCGLIDDLYRQAGATRARVTSWPRGIRSVRVLRHEINRSLKKGLVDKTLKKHAVAGTAATWFWASSAANPEAVRAVAEAHGQEVALNAERLWAGGDGEISTLRDAAGRAVVGAAARASEHCFRYQGAPNILWAESAGLSYVDLPARGHMHPHRFPSVRADGTLYVPDVVCLPGAESFANLSATNGLLEQRIAEWHRAGGLLQLECEPATSGVLATKPTEQCTEWTLEQAIRWWSRTHVGGNLRVFAREDGRYEISASMPVLGVGIELRYPTGNSRQHFIDVGPVPTIVGEQSSGSGSLSCWPDAGPIIEEAITQHRKLAGSTAGVELGHLVFENTDEIPRRAKYLMSLVRELTDRVTLTDLNVLDLRADFGMLDAYLAWQNDVCLMVGIQQQEAVRNCGHAVLGQIGLTGTVKLIASDPSTLAGINDHSLDLVIGQNVLLGMRRRLLRSSLLAIRRTLVSGGHLLVYHSQPPIRRGAIARRLAAFKGTTTELPGSAGGWLPSRRLARQLRGVGFRDIQVISYGPRGRIIGGEHDSKATAYALAARLQKGQTAPRAGFGRRRQAFSSPRRLAHYERIAEVFAGALRAHYESLGLDVESYPHSETVRTNTLLVRSRGDQVLRLLRRTLDIESLEGLRVLELGSGYGALACYLAWAARPLEVLAVDIDEKFVMSANSCAAQLDLDSVVRFERADMRYLDGVETGAFDVLIANNSLLYLPTREDLRAALAEMRRVASQSAGLLVYQANRWRWTEPFTRDPLVHLLAPSIARPVSKLTGWRHNHGRVRLVSPPTLRRELRHSGFVPTAAVGFPDRFPLVGPGKNLGLYFAQAARAQ